MSRSTPPPVQGAPAEGGTSRRQAEPLVRFRYPEPDTQSGPYIWSRIFRGLPPGARFCIIYSPSGDRYEVESWAEELGVRPRLYGPGNFPVVVVWGRHLRHCGPGVDALTFLQDHWRTA